MLRGSIRVALRWLTRVPERLQIIDTRIMALTDHVEEIRGLLDADFAARNIKPRWDEAGRLVQMPQAPVKRAPTRKRRKKA